MNFLAPIAAVFAAAVPVVILFYLLKRKRVVRLVPSTVLWQKFLAETQASAPFQRLRKNWLLFLQILLLLLAVFALMRPYFAAKIRPAQLRVIILDSSASMQARDEAPSRFEKARAEAISWVEGMANTDQMVILQAGANTEVKQSATSEKATLRRGLQACAPSDGPTRLVPALRMAESLVRDQRDAEIHLFSDGAVPDLSEFENKALPLIFHRVGKQGNNVGLIALDVLTVPIVLLNVLPLLALYAALKRVNESYALIALVLGLIAVPMLLTARPVIEMVMLSDKYAAATALAARSQYLAAGDALLEHFSGTAWLVETICLMVSGLISSLLMLRSPVFGKTTAYVGIATSLIGFGFVIPVIGNLLFLVNTILSIVFSILVARGLFRLVRQIDRVESSTITTGEFAR